MSSFKTETAISPFEPFKHQTVTHPFRNAFTPEHTQKHVFKNVKGKNTHFLKTKNTSQD